MNIQIRNCLSYIQTIQINRQHAQEFMIECNADAMYSTRTLAESQQRQKETRCLPLASISETETPFWASSPSTLSLPACDLLSAAPGCRHTHDVPKVRRVAAGRARSRREQTVRARIWEPNK